MNIQKVAEIILRASLKTVNGEISGDAHPKHHPECKPISTQILKAQEIDKSCRVRVREGVLTPKQAWTMVKLFVKKKFRFELFLQKISMFQICSSGFDCFLP